MQIKTLSDQQQNSGWRAFWPLYLSAAVMVILALWVYYNWHDLLLHSSLWQKELQQQLTKLLQQVKQHPLESGGMLMLFSFLYGMLHSAGPGHGKIIIAAYLATHPLKLRASLLLTLASSLVQGVVAVALVTLILSVFQLSTRMIHQSGFWLEKGSYVIIALVGTLLCYRALRQIWTAIKTQRTQAKRQIFSLTPLPADHVHNETCGCGHRHLPSPRELETAGGWKTQLAIIISIGLRPCSGAIVVLLFAKVIDIYAWGIAAAMAMALGTAMTISLLALFVYVARNAAEKLIAGSARSISGGLVLSSLSLLGGTLLILFGAMLYYAATPAASGGLRFLGS